MFHLYFPAFLSRTSTHSALCVIRLSKLSNLFAISLDKRPLLSGLVVAAFFVVPMIIVYAIMYIPFILAFASGAGMNREKLITMLIGFGIVDLFLIILMVCFHTLLMFSFPLIVDRNLSALAAIKTSAKAVWKNLGGVGGLIAVNFGLMILGYLALCIGLYFVIPVMIASTVVAYRKVFPANEYTNFDPPPPTAYKNI